MADAGRIVSNFIATIVDHLATGGRVELRGFGVFTTRSRLARMARHPRNGTAVALSARRAVYFKASRLLELEIQPGRRKTESVATSPVIGEA
jgi:integration host factor subunit beta